MPVTKSAKRALRGSVRKGEDNTLLMSKLEKAIRSARKTKKQADVVSAMSLADIAAKTHSIHKNKASRIKSSLSKLVKLEAKPKAKTATKTTPKKVTKKATSKK